MSAAYRRVRAYLITACLVFMGSSIVCMLIRPDLFDHPDYGISFFGSIRATLVPYTLGLLTVVYCLWATAGELKAYQHARGLRTGYLFGAACLLGITLTPMALNTFVWWTHIAISFILLVSQVAVTVWVLRQKHTTWIDYLIGAVFFGSGIATVLSGTWPGILGVYAIGELIVFNSSILLLGRAALHIIGHNQADVQ